MAQYQWFETSGPRAGPFCDLTAAVPGNCSDTRSWSILQGVRAI